MAETCRSCGAPIVWARVLSTRKAMPIDPNPVAGGNLVLTLRAVDAVVQAVPKGQGTHVSHFATCPNAGAHRKGKAHA